MIEEIIIESKDKSGVLIDVEISPNAKKNEIGGINEWRKRLIIKIKAQPIEGKANKEIIKFLKKIFKKDVEIVSGLTSSQKTILVVGGNREEIINTIKNLKKIKK
ncbi:DUF167 domain-containing protein [Methanothermococcus sp.]|uniref:DUF167 domain-containing protein n=1 Tax=Methanothermococcus sp. TaxID=2614238 RepID=UPI0026012059|nr:DUF167 domain-containing protein [Methanothermococcus sp.]